MYESHPAPHPVAALWMWHASRFRGQPSRGALLFDARLSDAGGGTLLAGRLRLGVAYIATVAWTAGYIVVGALIRLPWVLPAFLVLIAAIQVLGTALFGTRDAQPLLRFVDEVLAAEEETTGPGS